MWYAWKTSRVSEGSASSIIEEHEFTILCSSCVSIANGDLKLGLELEVDVEVEVDVGFSVMGECSVVVGWSGYFGGVGMVFDSGKGGNTIGVVSFTVSFISDIE